MPLKRQLSGHRSRSEPKEGDDNLSPLPIILMFSMLSVCRPGSSVGIATDYGMDGPGSNPGGDEIFRTCPDRPWGPSSLLYNGYRVFPGGKVRSGRAADHSPPSSATVMEE